MTYTVALAAKEKLGNTHYSKDGIQFEVLVTPLKWQYLKPYCQNYPGGGYTDETALTYAKDHKFTMHGMAAYESFSIRDTVLSK